MIWLNPYILILSNKRVSSLMCQPSSFTMYYNSKQDVEFNCDIHQKKRILQKSILRLLKYGYQQLLSMRVSNFAKIFRACGCLPLQTRPWATVHDSRKRRDPCRRCRQWLADSLQAGSQTVGLGWQQSAPSEIALQTARLPAVLRAPASSPAVLPINTSRGCH